MKSNTTTNRAIYCNKVQQSALAQGCCEMCMVEDSQVVDAKGVCKIKAVAEATYPEQSKVEDDKLSILPSNMRKHVLASKNRNRAAFARLAKM
jgi:hypothetical protein